MIVRPTTALVLCLLPVLACGPKEQPTTTPEPEPVEQPPPPPDPIPADFGALTPQIVVPDIQAALDFYGQAFGAETKSTLNGPDGALMHAEIQIGDSVIMVEPTNEQMKDPMALGGSPVTLMLYVEDADAAFEKATGAGAIVNTPLEDQFWGDRYGQLIDPFGHAWAVATHIEDLTDEQLQERVALLPKKKKKKKNKKPKWASVEGTPATQKVPEGYHTVTMSLTVADAAAAIDFYTKAFGATERGRMPGPDGKLMHAELDIGGDILMLSDEMPGGAGSAQTLGGSPVMIHHYVADVDATFGTAVSSGGTELWALSDTFWGDRYGAIVDPAGLPWGVASHKEDLTPEQMKERMEAAMAAEGGAAAPTEGEAAAPAEGDAPPAEPAA